MCCHQSRPRKHGGEHCSLRWVHACGICAKCKIGFNCSSRTRTRLECLVHRAPETCCHRRRQPVYLCAVCCSTDHQGSSSLCPETRACWETLHALCLDTDATASLLARLLTSASPACVNAQIPDSADHRDSGVCKNCHGERAASRRRSDHAAFETIQLHAALLQTTYQAGTPCLCCVDCWTSLTSHPNH